MDRRLSRDRLLEGPCTLIHFFIWILVRMNPNSKSVTWKHRPDHLIWTFPTFKSKIRKNKFSDFSNVSWLWKWHNDLIKSVLELCKLNSSYKQLSHITVCRPFWPFFLKSLQTTFQKWPSNDLQMTAGTHCSRSKTIRTINRAKWT